MSKITENTQSRKRQSIRSLQSKKTAGEKLSMITCYDSTFAKLINHTDIDMVLVGDSLGNVMMGYGNTLKVSVDDMARYGASVARSLDHAFLVIDMPFMSYNISLEETLRNATKLISDAGGQAVKMEGGKAICDKVKACVDAGIPVMGHLGLTPQSIHTIGGYRVQGRDQEDAARMIEDAKALENAGAFSLVLEMVPSELAKEISEALSIPVIGIGAGVDCDGQVLVLQDLLGMDSGFKPKFLKNYANLSEVIVGALSEYNSEVKDKVFPAAEHSFK
ncbi:3-methyl-2-oxobutanoate hydroxymethyltransferase [bacterium]|nr:3-methyl-2-oxobutanoate hydroxymethyltransferase [bacterium]